MKPTESQIEQMNELKKTNTSLEISKLFNIAPSLVRYYTGRREKCIKESIERIRNLSPEQKRIRYEKSKEYQKKYHRNKYLNDLEFREKAKKRSREWKRRKK
jgi:hypothetical protein